MDKPCDRQKGFNIVLEPINDNEMLAFHTARLLVLLDNFCQSYGYNIVKMETTVKGENNEN